MRVFASFIALAAVWTAAPIAAHADPGFIAMRTFAYAGPDEDFPRVAYLRRGTRLDVRGCLERDNWCDVRWGRHRYDRGWVNEDVIAFYYRGRSWRSYDYFRFRRPVIVIWDIDRYWGEYYRTERFFRQRDSFRRFGPHDDHNRNNDGHGRGDRGAVDQNQAPNTNEPPRDDRRDRRGSAHDQAGPGADQDANDNSRGSDERHGRGQTQSNDQHQTDTPPDDRRRHSDSSQGPQGQQTGQQTGQGQGSQAGAQTGHDDAQGQEGEQEHAGRHNRDRNANDNPHNCPLNDEHQPVCPSP